MSEKRTIVVEPSLPTAIPTLDRWFGREMHDKVIGHPRDRHLAGGLLIGCPIWGADFVRSFLTYTLPSMLAPRNLAALAHRSRIVIYAPSVEARVLWESLREVENRFDIEFQLEELPADVVKITEAHPHMRYPLLGSVQTLLLHMAGRGDMGFHMLQPDHIYGEAYFENLFRLAEDFPAISQTSISVSVETAAAELEKYRAGPALIVPDRELGDIGWRNIHPRSRLSIMNDKRHPDRLPWSHLWNWQGRDKLHIYCWHTNATYMAPELCQRVPAMSMSTLDTLLPMYMGGHDVAFPSAEDGMTFIELSDASKPCEEEPVDFEEFGHRVWGIVSYQDSHMPFMRMCSEVPIAEQSTFIEKDEIERQHAELLEELVANRDRLEETDEMIAYVRRVATKKEPATAS